MRRIGILLTVIVVLTVAVAAGCAPTHEVEAEVVPGDAGAVTGTGTYREGEEAVPFGDDPR